MAGNNDNISTNNVYSGVDDNPSQAYNGNGTGQTTDNSNVETNNEVVSPNISFVTRVLHETNNQVYGVEILLYGSDGSSPIKKLLITDENEFNAWVSFVENMKGAYVYGTEDDLANLTQLRTLKQQLESNSITQSEYEESLGNIVWSDYHEKSLDTILKNEKDISTNQYLYEINATKFMGMNSDDFAKSNHSHNFPPFNHRDLKGSYGVADTEHYGHTKIVNNLDNGLNNTGHALSAYQGYLLGQRVSTLEDDKKYDWSTIKENGQYCRYSVNEGLRLVTLYVSYPNCTEFKTKAQTISLGSFSTDYTPTQMVINPTQRGDVTIFVTSGGAIKVRSLTKINKFNINAQLLWHY